MHRRPGTRIGVFVAGLLLTSVSVYEVDQDVQVDPKPQTTSQCGYELLTSKPYNGSIPTVWHLMQSEKRPVVWIRDEN